MKLAGLKPQHFLWEVADRIAVVRLNRPDRKNPLTFESYAELRDTFRALVYAEDVDVVVFASNGGNFCSGGDVHDIIGPLIGLPMKDLLAFTRMTGDLVKAMISCGKPIIAAVDGVAVGAGAIISMAADLRLATHEAKTAFLFTRVGLGGGGTALYGPRDVSSRGRAVGLLERAAWRGRAGGRGDEPCAAAGFGADLCPFHDQDAVEPRMEYGAGAGYRGRGAGAGDLHADQGFRARLQRLCRQGKAGFRGELTDGGFTPPRENRL